MSLRDCLNSAVQQGAINSRQADELHRYYETRFQRKRANMSERDAAAAARDEVVSALRQEAKEQRRQVLLSEARRKELAEFVQNYRNHKGKPDQLDAVLSLITHNGFKGTQSMDGKAKAIIQFAQRELAEVMHHFRRTGGTGMRMNKVDIPDLIKAMHGEPVDNPAAKAFASALSGVLQELKLRFNDAGGNIPTRQDWGIVHSHNRREISKLGATPDEARARWKEIIRPLLNPDEMTNPNTGETIGAAGLDSSLDYVFETLVSDGWAHRRPESRKFGKGKVASRYQDARFLVFKDAASWLAYNERFGDQDPIGSIFNHINGMARDIAAMERFGPNPDATIEWLKQAVRVNIGKQQAGSASVFGKVPGISDGAWSDYRIDSLWRVMRGRETVLDAPAKIAGDIRNLATAAMLGTTGLLSAMTDPFVAAAARRLAGLPVMKDFGETLKRFANEDDRRAMVRRAVLWEDYMHTMHEQARFVDQMFGHEWSRTLVDRAMTWNALKPMTEARKRAEASAWHETLGGFAEKATDWIDLPELTKRAMEGFGISADDWHRMRAGVDEIGFLDPGGVFEKTGDRQLAEKYAELITQWSERSVPSGDPRIKSVLTGGTQRGTILGEIADFGSQFMSFGMSFTARQFEAMYVYSMISHSRSGQIARGSWYFASMAVPLTIGAAMYVQMLNVLNGKDPEDMTDPAFWAKAFVKGGGGGLFADFVDRAENRFGQSLSGTIPGPGVAFIGDTLDLSLRGIRSIVAAGIGDEDMADDQRFGRNLSRYAGRYTPILSSHPLTRAAYRRAFVDQLQWLTDPDADASFRAQKRKSSFWWEPGETSFRRLPDMETAFGDGRW